MPRVVHFEISCDEPDRAIDFYRTVFDWTFARWDGPQDYWLVTTGPDSQPGINGGMFRRGGPINYVNTVEVDCIDDYVAKVEAQGGSVVVPKMPIPGVGHLVYCKDSEGNVFGMMQMDPNVG
jgi:uncharacterized protein